MFLPYKMQRSLAFRAALQYAIKADSYDEIITVSRLVAEEDHEGVAKYLQGKGWKIRYSDEEYRVLNTPATKDTIPACKSLTLGQDVDALHPEYGWVAAEISDFQNGDMFILEIPSKNYEEFQAHELDIALLNTHSDPFGS